MQRDWARQKKLRTTGETNIEGVREKYMREQDKKFIRFVRRVYPELYTGDWYV